ncbi:hypothetical protein OPT61_g1914 [Boeremia exigua]|uniref:Uncharacterized protein n=1 Tax=Boeremia exigua TaxID=749465 RepID=A0ACC2INK8_9PLEO|nr:hypothetical protein OPT61_g1914 [Boeremia exigua]
MKRIVCTLLLAIHATLTTSDTVNRPLSLNRTASILGNISTPRISVPFGHSSGVKFSEPLQVHTASRFDINNAASDQVWETYRAKGSWYTCLLDMTTEQAGTALEDKRVPPSAESIWQGDFQDEVSKWGWTEFDLNDDGGGDFRDDSESADNKIGTALTALGLSLLPASKDGNNVCYAIEHSDDLGDDEDPDDDVDMDNEGFYVVDGKQYLLTEAYYRFTLNQKEGVIFAQNLLSPRAAALTNFEDPIPPEELPALARASDIMWLYWLRGNPNPQNLRYYIVNYVLNTATLPLIARALKTHGFQTVPHWPGLQLDMPDPAALALLGSPIGSTLAHLLMQHKVALGIKHITSITVFRNNPPPGQAHSEIPEVQLLFSIAEGPSGGGQGAVSARRGMGRGPGRSFGARGIRVDKRLGAGSVMRRWLLEA